MKAEHRKELETNILADKVGRIITNAKQGPSRGLLFYVIIAVVILAAIFLTWRYFTRGRESVSRDWAVLEDGTNEQLEGLFQSKSNAGKAAKLQLAWRIYWFGGMKRLGASPKQAILAIDEAESIYKDVASKCKGDPIFEPEALYALAVIEETRLLNEKNREDIQPVKDKYQEVVKAGGKDSAFAALAKARLDELQDDVKGREIVDFYRDLAFILFRDDRRQGGPRFEMEDLERLMRDMKKKQPQLP